MDNLIDKFNENKLFALIKQLTILIHQKCSLSLLIMNSSLQLSTHLPLKKKNSWMLKERIIMSCILKFLLLIKKFQF